MNVIMKASNHKKLIVQKQMLNTKTFRRKNI